MIKNIKALIIRRKKTAWVTLIVVIFLCFSLLHKHNSSKKKTVQWLTVHPREAVISIHKYGKIITGHNFSITAPFSGKILKMYYNLGDKVTKGQKLLVLSKEEIAKKQHQAQSAYLKSKNDYETYLHWKTSSQVQKAQQSLLNSQQQIKIDKEKLKDDEFLYKKGIISRDTLDQQKHAVRQDKQQLESQQLSLKDTLKQGDKDNLLIKKLALEDAKNTLDTINQQIAHATIIAPATGVALKPTGTGAKNNSSFVAVEGEEVSANQNLLTIGNAQNLEVKGNLNQEEINQIKTGLPVVVTSDAFPGVSIKGTIFSISRLANQDESSAPTFPFVVNLNTLTKKERKLMRLGLMVDIALETYRNDKAIVVPVNAIYSDKDKDYVWVRNPQGQVEKRFIKRGPSLPDGVVVKQGLQAGEQVKVTS